MHLSSPKSTRSKFNWFHFGSVLVAYAVGKCTYGFMKKKKKTKKNKTKSNRPSQAAGPLLLSWVSWARRGGALCADAEWSEWSLPHWGRPAEMGAQVWLITHIGVQERTNKQKKIKIIHSINGHNHVSDVHYNITFSPVMANGALNHCSKVLQLLKIVGSRKFSRAQSSGSLFCRGVPVSSTRLGAR